MSCQIVKLRTEHVTNPLGIDVVQPRFSWKLISDKRGVIQTAYQIVVASSPNLLNKGHYDIWDSGKIKSDETHLIPYEGQTLRSQASYYWKVRIWDGHDHSTDWSEIATWSMGLLHRDEWEGRWIGLRNNIVPSYDQSKPVVYLHKSFPLAADHGRIKKATAYASALGVYVLYVNGSKASDAIFAPEWTDYQVRTQYQTYDVSPLLTEGENALGVVLGPGWYAGYIGMFGFQKYGQDPAFLLQLNVEYEDGTTQRISTDTSWEAGYGPIVSADLQMGEFYDARKEHEGWNQAGFHGKKHGFQHAERMHDYRGSLTAQIAPPIRVMDELAPKQVIELDSYHRIYDFGQNMGGWAHLLVQGKRGTKLILRFGETLDDKGKLYTENLRHAKQTDTYILRGGQQEQYEPTFSFHGFRYMEVSWDSEECPILEVTAKVAYSSMPQTGWMETSDPMINQLLRNILWSQRGNFVSVPTDCPQRDERHGWMGDAQIFCDTAAYYMDTAAFYTKWIRDIRDAQRHTGAYPDFAPFIPGPKSDYDNDFTYTHTASSGWGDAGIIVPWMLYEVYGDRRILEEHFDSMLGWVNYLWEHFPHGIRDDIPQYGDWLSVPYEVFGEETPNYDNIAELSTTPYDVFGTAYHAYSVYLLARIADVLGYEQHQQKLEARFHELKQVFQQTFVAEDGKIKGHTQTIYVMALSMHLLEPAQEKAAVRYLVEDIRKRGNRLSTGFHGIKYLMPVLSEYGYDDLALILLHQDSYPSWKYPIKHGATTIWERWDGWTEEKGFQRAGMNSFNHYSFGSVGHWLFRYVGGIGQESGGTSYKHLLLHPRVGRGLSSANCKYESVYGTIVSDWKLEGDNLTYLVEVPPNCRAKVVLPTTSDITIDGSSISTHDHIHHINVEDENTIFTIESGTYRFKCRCRYRA